MNKEPLVSIVMPAYNCGKYIKESIQSVIDQTYRNWELIIIDDNSTDNTKEIIASFKDTRIKYHRNSNNYGVAKARNKGINISGGVFIAFLDSDDYWKNTKLYKQINLTKKGYDFIFTGSGYTDEEGREYGYVLTVPEKINKNELLKQNLISCSSVLISKNLLKDNYFVEETKYMIHEDYVLWLTILDKIEFAYSINEPLLIYRIRGNSKSSKKIEAAIMNWNALKHCEINFFVSCKYMIIYCCRGINKYLKIRGSV